MFKLKFLFFNVMLLIVAISGVLAQAHAAELKIGFVNAPRVLEVSPQAEQARIQLEKEFAPRDKEIEDLQKSLRKMEDKLNRDGAVMSEAERLKLEKKTRVGARDLKRSREEFREDLSIRKNEAFERLRRRVFEVIQTIASNNKYDLIVSEGVLYASQSIDITNLVLKELDKDIAVTDQKTSQ